MIRLFEAFAGYGSQRMALKNIGIDFESVGISEIEGNVIKSYAAIHEDLHHVMENFDAFFKNVSEEEMKNFLLSINVPLDYKTFVNLTPKLKGDNLKLMYAANKISKNFGDIKNINPYTLPDFDFFTYSFPCQDISVAGYQKGLDAESGTRSSLLWECSKIINVKRPKYLMMENVKNLVGKNHIKNFNNFLGYLESLGYINSWKVLTAKDFGIPQSRERVFCISILDSVDPFIFPNGTQLNDDNVLQNYLEENVEDSFYLNNNQVLDEPINQKVCYCIDSNYWKGSTLKSFIEKRRRQLVTDNKKNDQGQYIPRKLTPKETWKLMGVSEEDFEKAEEYNPKTQLYRQAGNSIVVNVLEAIYKELFKEAD